MMMSFDGTVPMAPLLLIVCTAMLFLTFKSWTGSKFLPPSPKGYPLIGSLLDITKAAKKHQVHLLFERWARELGEVMRVKVGPVTEYYINSDIATKELLDKNTAQTSERPRWIVANEQICGKWNVLFLSASDPRWKNQRKITNQNLTSPSRADATVPLLEFEALRFMHEVVNDPKAGTPEQDLWVQFGRYIYSLFSLQMFGLEIRNSDSPAMAHMFDTGATEIVATFPGEYLVESFPWLEYLPMFLKKWERDGRQRFRNDIAWVKKRVDYVKQLMKSNRLPDAFLPRVLADGKLGGCESEEEVAYICLQLILGGSDTSRLATWSFLEAMLMNPDKYEKVQKLVDETIGDERIPGWSDFEKIPYIRAIMKEVWRMRPPNAMGFQHVSTIDLQYGSYHIPKGSILRLNTWAVSYDPNRHQDPYKFIPERYENDDLNSQQSANLADFKKRDHFAFGVGRRMCPGQHVAERSFAISILRILWAFDIKPKPGTKLPINMADYPHHFPGFAGTNMPVTLTVRSPKKADIINEAYKAAMANRPQYGTMDLE